MGLTASPSRRVTSASRNWSRPNASDGNASDLNVINAFGADFVPEYPKEDKFYLPPPQKLLTIREAAFRDYEEIPVTKAAGRICASLDLPCPPAVPIAVSGELMTAELAEIMQSFGIDKVRVVKNDIKE